MFEVCGESVRITQGDSGLLGFVPIVPLPEGTVRAVFTVKKRSGGAALIEVSGAPDAEGTVRAVLTPEATERMRPGLYAWDVRYELASGEVITPLPPGEFEVMKAVGRL